MSPWKSSGVGTTAQTMSFLSCCSRALTVMLSQGHAHLSKDILFNLQNVHFIFKSVMEELTYLLKSEL